jgi:hypothetical protein
MRDVRDGRRGAVARRPARSSAILCITWACAAASCDSSTSYRDPSRAVGFYTREAMRKTSVYLDEQQAERLARLARQEGRSQAEILRAAITAYQPAPSRDRDFALGTGFARIDRDPRPISQIPDHELLEGFGG